MKHKDLLFVHEALTAIIEELKHTSYDVSKLRTSRQLVIDDLLPTKTAEDKQWERN